MNKYLNISFILSTMILTSHVYAEEKVQRLYIGETLYLADPSITDVVVGNNSVITVKPVGKKGVAITGVAIGDTSVKIWRGAQYNSANIHVGPANLERIYQELSQLLIPYANVEVKIVNDNVMITGEDLLPQEKEKIDNYTTLFPNVINLTKTLENKVAEKQKMVYLDVRIVEISTSDLKEIGIKWSSSTAGPSFGIIGDITKDNVFTNSDNPLAENISTFQKVNPFQAYFGLASFIDSKINLLQEQGTAKLIARPLLSSKNGGKAAFLSGGQIPYQTASATGTPSVDFKDYGIKLEIQPKIVSDGIMANIMAEVSNIDRSISIDGVPGLLTRKTETEFVVKEGETLVLSGLVSSTSNDTNSSVPGLGQVPILGNLFKSKNKSLIKSELVFFVTPYIYDGQYSQNMIEKIENSKKDIYLDLEENSLLPDNID